MNSICCYTLLFFIFCYDRKHKTTLLKYEYRKESFETSNTKYVCSVSKFLLVIIVECRLWIDTIIKIRICNVYTENS